MYFFVWYISILSVCFIKHNVKFKIFTFEVEIRFLYGIKICHAQHHHFLSFVVIVFNSTEEFKKKKTKQQNHLNLGQSINFYSFTV